MARKPKKYVNNRDLLKEIHISKMSYSYALDDKYKRFDVILNSLDEINSETIQTAKEVYANKLSVAAHDEAVEIWTNIKMKKGVKPKIAEHRVDPATIGDDEIVFRIMTYDHIPETPGRKRTHKTEADKRAPCNFPPFKHYALINGEWTEVARSHWQGGFDNGHFSTDHGRLTNKLGKMMMKLVERNALKSNWRNYTYNDEMQCSALVQLSEAGLKFNEAKGDNPFAYYTSTINNSFTRILNLEKKAQSLRDDILQQQGQMPSFTRQLEDELQQQEAREQSNKEQSE